LRVELRLDSENKFISGGVLNGLLENEDIDMKAFYVMRVLFDGVEKQGRLCDCDVVGGAGITVSTIFQKTQVYRLF